MFPLQIVFLLTKVARSRVYFKKPSGVDRAIKKPAFMPAFLCLIEVMVLSPDLLIVGGFDGPGRRKAL